MAYSMALDLVSNRVKGGNKVGELIWNTPYMKQLVYLEKENIRIVKRESKFWGRSRIIT